MKYVSILTRNYEVYRSVGDPLSQVDIMQSNLVDEIVLVNRTKVFEEKFCELVARVSERVSTPLTVGGAISVPSHCYSLIAAGADKLILGQNSGDNDLAVFISETFGAQASVLSFDYKSDILNESNFSLSSLMNMVETSCFGEVFMNCISKDGGNSGPELKFASLVAATTNIPVIFGCGYSKISHLVEGFNQGASGISLSTHLAQMDQSPRQIRAHLKASGIHVRTRN